MSFTVFQGIEFFPLREFCKKTKINGNPKVQCLVHMVDKSELLSQAVTVLAWPSKKHAVFCYLDGSEVKSLSRVQLFVTPRTIAYQAPRSMAFSRQEYWSGLSFPSPGDLPNSGIEPKTPELAGRFFTTEPPGKLWDESVVLNISNSLNTR